MKLIVALLAGVLFAMGLIVSEMVNPAKVLNFLDLAGTWDPTLAFVMGGALLVTIPGYRWILRRPHPVLDDKFHLPPPAPVDLRLIVGAAIFGIGWGIAGFCPGPAVAALATGLVPVFLFVIAMLGGMLLARAWPG